MFIYCILDNTFVLSPCLTWCASRRDVSSGKNHYFCPSKDMGDIEVHLYVL